MSARAGFAELLPDGHEFPEFDPDRLEELLANPRVRILVAESDGKVIGHTGFGASRDDDAPEDVGEVRAFFVNPGAWRRGVGRALMEGALAGLAEMGFRAATLWSFAGNERANRFYEALGFRRDGTERREQVWAGVLEVRYRRELA